ncbi:Pilin/Flagellin, FlaG/FlaF family [Halorhabdus sp. SVX81]|nr:Pilin/Flagellin, FlaG/FlaF family [Halorhabdus sp. SVX81]WEL21842.1 Pilin/Flagellin, FlaG/FlaF family [Halorhabdus sp. BNX81]
MVAVTVLLAAVVGTFVMNMDMPENQPPSTSWDISEEGDAIVIEHDGGESATAEELTAVISYEGSHPAERYTFADANGYSDGDTVTATDSMELVYGGTTPATDYIDLTAGSLSVSDVDEVQLIWVSSTGSQSQPLTTWTR